MPDVAAHSPQYVSICSGGGGLDLGVKLAAPDARCVLYVEREVAAAAVLAKGIAAGLLDDAPIWSDIGTLDVGPWRGRVGGIVGGIPCQPHSIAGKRLGEDDERDLWPLAARLVFDLAPDWVFLENVPGILRYYHRVIRPDLQALGYTVTEGLFSAAEVGAPHLRERLFWLAYRGSDATEIASGELRQVTQSDAGRRSRELAYRGSARGQGGELLRGTVTPSFGRREAGSSSTTSQDVAYAGHSTGSAEQEQQPRERTEGNRRSGETVAAAEGDGLEGRTAFSEQGRSPVARGGEALADAFGLGHDGRAPEQGRGTRGRTAAEEAGAVMGDTDRPRLQGRGREQRLREDAPKAQASGGRESLGEPDGARRPEAGQRSGLDTRPESQAGGRAFPPGPADRAGWASWLAGHPGTEPAIPRAQSSIRGSLDGLAFRAERLRILGNGVIPVVAAHAWRTLTARMGGLGG